MNHKDEEMCESKSCVVEMCCQKKERELEEERTMKTPLADYATEAISRSLVTGVSNIVETKNKFRKVFKTVVLLSCAAGFFYQATAFVQFILTYPSVVSIEVYRPESFVRPAYTICNNNGIRRTKFCSKYPEKCYTPESIPKFCAQHEFFCSTLEDKENFTVVKPEFYGFEREISFEELKVLGHDDNFISMVSLWKDVGEFEGPLLMRKEDGRFLMCYTIFLRVNSSLDPAEVYRFTEFNSIVDAFWFYPEPHEVFLPERYAGVIFNMHSPFILENPLQKGIFVRLKRSYLMHLRLEEEHLLPHPYDSNCLNYTKEWIERGRTGPRSKEACVQRCGLIFTLQDCNCTFPEVLYPSNGPFCDFEYDVCTNNNPQRYYEMAEEASECFGKCRDDCQKFKYRFDYQQRMIESDSDYYNGTWDKYVSAVQIIAPNLEVVKFKYRPQYQNLEVFSNLGGFIGAWLGVSLVAVIDMFESLFMIGRFLFLKKRSLKRAADQ